MTLKHYELTIELPDSRQIKAKVTGWTQEMAIGDYLAHMKRANTPAKVVGATRTGFEVPANGAEQQGKEGNPPLPRFPRAAHYQGSARKRFEAGVRAAKRYYATFPQDGYSRAIERADGRNEPSAWYDGWDSVCNPSYFEAK